MSRWTIGVGIVVCVAGIATGSAQTPSEEPDETVRLDAVVTDRHQQPIRGLRTADFIVSDSGQVRTVESVTARRSTGHRVIAIFLDEFHVDAGDATLRARAALNAFVQTQLGPEDLV